MQLAPYSLALVGVAGLLPLVSAEVEAVALVVDVDVGSVALVDLAVDELGGAALDLAGRQVGQRLVGLQVVAVRVRRRQLRADPTPITTNGKRYAVGRDVLRGDGRDQE